MDLKEIGYQNVVKRQALVNTVMKFMVP